MSPVPFIFLREMEEGVDLGERKVVGGNGKSGGTENCRQDEMH